MKVSKFFQSNPVFRHEMFAAFLNANGTRTAKTREALLAYHVNKGHLLRVRRGLYAVVPEGINPKRHQVDPYLLGAHMTEDAVLAYHSALQFHGKAYSMHYRFPYLSRHSRRSFGFQGLEFTAALFPKTLKTNNSELFGVETYNHIGGKVRVTNLERTMVDVLMRPDLCGGWEEVWRCLESVEYFNLTQVIDYVLMTRSATAVAKVGFFLEQHRNTLMVEEAQLDLLRKHIPNQPCYLDRSRREPGKLVNSWQLVVPPTVLERTWEEVP